jgi:hypothetical protein
MTWLTWRQFRMSALPVFGVLGAVALALAYTGPDLYREYNDTVAGCQDRCGPVFDTFFEPRLGLHIGLNLLVMAVPAVVGMFWGAPLIGREFETGSQDLVWQQSVTRRRWLAVKLGLVGLAAIAAAALAVVPVSWWSRPLDATAFTGVTRLSPSLFDVRGYVVLGHTAFVLTVGVAAGLLIRRTVPAMAVTLAIFIAVQILMPTWVRPHFATPARLEATITARNLTGIDQSSPGGPIRGIHVEASIPGAWILTGEVVGPDGLATDTFPDWAGACAPPEEPAAEVPQHECLQRLAAAGYRQVVTYHPAERFWPFQAYETAIFGILSLLLAGFCFLRMRPD